MEPRKIAGFALLPTAILFGLGIGNLWGIAGLFTQLGNPKWVWMLQLACLAVLITFLCGVARAWWVRGAVMPMFLMVAAAWLFSAPAAAVMGKFTLWGWAIWLLVLAGCGSLALLLAWLFERGRWGDA
jgi:hypothetical protein